MKFKQKDVGDHRIYAVALDSSAGGFIAGVEVRRLREAEYSDPVLWRDEELFGGRTFDSASEALCRALDTGYAKLRRLGLGPDTMGSPAC